MSENNCAMSNLAKNAVEFEENPFCWTVLPHRLPLCCSFCFAGASTTTRLLRCSKCKFLHYCDANCQRNDWPQHKIECKRLRRLAPYLKANGVVNLPPQIVASIFADFLDDNGGSLLQNIGVMEFPDEALRLVARLFDIYDKPETISYESGGRSLSDLPSYANEILADDDRRKQFDCFARLFEYFYFGHTNTVNEYDRNRLLEVYGKCRYHAMGIKDEDAQPVGCGLFVNFRRLQHSCQPNVRFIFDGRKAVISPLFADNKHSISAYDDMRCAYIDELAPKEERNRLLKERFFIDCKCDGCENEDWNNSMEALRCDAVDYCDGMVVQRKREKQMDGETISIGSHDCETIYVCLTCGKTLDDIENARAVIAVTDNVINDLATQKAALANPEWAMKIYVQTAAMQMPVLHPFNINRLRTMRAAYETACRLRKWTEAAEYGAEMLVAYRKYLNSKTDPEYGVVALNVAKTFINSRDRISARDILDECHVCFEHVYGADSRQLQRVTDLMNLCKQSK